MNFEPMGACVCIRQLPDAPKSKLIEVIGMNQRFGRALVVTCGPDVLDLKPGDVVVVSLAAGTRIPDDLLIVPESSCIATVQS